MKYLLVKTDHYNITFIFQGDKNKGILEIKFADTMLLLEFLEFYIVTDSNNIHYNINSFSTTITL